MQTSTDKNELAIRKKDELKELLAAALEHHTHCEAARSAVENAQQLALFHAWQAGIRLNKMKAIVGHGNWIDWMETNLRISIRTVQVYMKIDNDNPQLRAAKPNTQRVAHLKFDTIRKYVIGFVPEKDRKQLVGDKKFARSVSFLNIINEFERIVQRHKNGQQLIDFDLVREETAALYKLLAWVHGNSTETSPPL